MKQQTLPMALVSLLFFTAGCATTESAKETETLQTKVASLEGQVGDLNQRVEELSKQQAGSETVSGSSSVSRNTTAKNHKVDSTPLSTRNIQIALKTAGFYEGTVDGKWGLQTKRAIKAFQRAKGLYPDGKVGPKTAMALAKYLPSASPPE